MDLYKKDAKGNTRLWRIYQTDTDEFQWEHGMLNGEMQIEAKCVEAKAGRTDQEQVDLEMNSKIESKKNAGYVDDIRKISSVIKNQLGFEKQMKAKLLKDGDTPNVVYGSHSHLQRKLNGHRCTVVRLSGVVTAYSSGGKPITSIEHILDGIRILEGQKLDGELYIHGLSLQKISSKVRKKKEQATDLEFRIFDQVSDEPFIDRYNSIPKQTNPNCIIVETIQVFNFSEVKKLFKQFRAEGYEGAMLRHGKKGYEAGRRSGSIYKIKKMEGEGYYDDEFKVIGIVASTEGWARLVCVTKGGQKFKVSCHGDVAYKKYVLRNIEKFVGKFVKVEYPELTDSGKPSQPIALDWREKGEG